MAREELLAGSCRTKGKGEGTRMRIYFAYTSRERDAEFLFGVCRSGPSVTLGVIPARTFIAPGFSALAGGR